MGDFNANYNSVNTKDGLMAQVIDGVIRKTNQVQKPKTAKEMNALGKDAFLKLLCAQMENQDPLQPQSNTEWVTQLATYSTLEEMQNMNSTINNSQAMGLVGKHVVLATKNANGQDTTVNGVVDYVSVKKGKAYLSIKGNLYPAEDLQSVIDGNYLNNSVLPKVQKTEMEFDKKKPADVRFKVSFGGEFGKATGLGLTLNGKNIPTDQFKVYDNGDVVISKEALKDLPKGRYKIRVTFNNQLRTQDSDSLTLKVTEGQEGNQGNGSGTQKPGNNNGGANGGTGGTNGNNGNNGNNGGTTGGQTNPPTGGTQNPGNNNGGKSGNGGTTGGANNGSNG